ncbi:MAG: glycine betaine ABC transporter substrate-binding protein [Planctomycetota bacterium]
MRRLWLLLIVFVIGCDAADDPVAVGSKTFAESAILASMLDELADEADVDAELRSGLGDSIICFKALERGEIDAYPEYTGTLIAELLAGEDVTEANLEAVLAERGLGIAARVGFNNTYAIGVRRDVAQARGLRTISDLRDHPDLRFVVSTAFLDRPDGWPGLSATYGLSQTDVRGLDHALGYAALNNGGADAIDVYATDAEIAAYDLVVLEDDRRHFPVYDAVVLYRLDMDQRHPGVVAQWRRMDGLIDATTMSAANKRVVIDKQREAAVGAEVIAELLNLDRDAQPLERTTAIQVREILGWTGWHLLLTLVPMAGAIVIAIPLGIAAAKNPTLGAVVPGGVGVIQTIPSLALLILFIPLLGLGFWPAALALMLYALLPIVRNTQAGIAGIAPDLVESARALGLSPGDRLLRVELPLALPSILAGIKTSAVITVGFAVLGAFVGAGGYGEPIFRGLRTDNTALMLEGAIASAVLALLVSGLFRVLERLIVPRGLQR